MKAAALSQPMRRKLPPAKGPRMINSNTYEYGHDSQSEIDKVMVVVMCLVWSSSSDDVEAMKRMRELLLVLHFLFDKLFMSRSAHESSTLPWLPNELMFEICHALFELYRDEDRS